jgi:hypothetical protein
VAVDRDLAGLVGRGGHLGDGLGGYDSAHGRSPVEGDGRRLIKGASGMPDEPGAGKTAAEVLASA